MNINNLHFTTVFVEDPEGGYAAYVEEIPGTNSQGETLEEAKENLKEAVSLILNQLSKKFLLSSDKDS